MKTSFLYFLYGLFLSLTSTNVLLWAGPDTSPDTPTGMAYQLLFEQRLPLFDRAIDPKDVSETMATMLMLNRFEGYCLEHDDSILTTAFDKKTVTEQLNSTEKKAFTKIQTAINDIIENDIIKIIKQQAKTFEKHNDKGWIGTTVQKARGWFAKKLSSDKKALEDYADYTFRHISPAYTDAAPGLLKNNLEFLYEELFNIIQTARKVGDLFVLFTFLGKYERISITPKLDHITIAAKSLRDILTTYINEIEKRADLDTHDSLIFFAQKYQLDAGNVLKNIVIYLKDLEDSAHSKKFSEAKDITKKSNIENFFTFTILPSTFMDRNLINLTSTMQSKIQSQQKDIQTLQERIRSLERDNANLKNQIIVSPVIQKNKEEKIRTKTEIKKRSDKINNDLIALQKKIETDNRERKEENISPILDDIANLRALILASDFNKKNLETQINNLENSWYYFRDKPQESTKNEPKERIERVTPPETRGRSLSVPPTSRLLINEDIPLVDPNVTTPPRQISSESVPLLQPSEAKIELLKIQKRINETSSINELDNIQHSLEIVNVSKDSPDTGLYNTVKNALTNKIEQIINENIQKFVTLEKEITDATTTEALDEILIKINNIKISPEKGEDFKKRNAVLLTFSAKAKIIKGKK